MATQEDFWNSLGQGTGAAEDRDPLPQSIYFQAMNTPIQGVVVETYQTTEKGFNGAPDPVDKNGNPRPQLVLTLKLVSDYTGLHKQNGPFTVKAGELARVYLKTDLLWKTRDAMAAKGMSSLSNGTLWQGAWVDQEQLERGTAKRHKVQVTPPQEG